MNKSKLNEKLIIAHPEDNVGTARIEIQENTVLLKNKNQEITVHEKIPFGFKMAVKDISQGSGIIKYGQRIGVATKDISIGDLVHVHNVSGERGKSQ